MKRLSRSFSFSKDKDKDKDKDHHDKDKDKKPEPQSKGKDPGAAHTNCLLSDFLVETPIVDDPNKAFKCVVCGRGFRTQKGMTTHQGEDHTGTQKKIHKKFFFNCCLEKELQRARDKAALEKKNNPQPTPAAQKTVSQQPNHQKLFPEILRGLILVGRTISSSHRTRRFYFQGFTRFEGSVLRWRFCQWG